MMERHEFHRWHGLTIILAVILTLYTATPGVNSMSEYTNAQENDLSSELVQRFLEEADAIMDRKLMELSEMVRRLREEEPMRHRRSIPTTLTRSETEILEFQRIDAFASLGLPFFNDIELVAYDGYLLSTVVTGEKFSRQNHTEIFKILENGTVTLLQIWDSSEFEVHNVGMFLLDATVYLVLAGDLGVYILQFSPNTGEFEQVQLISTINAFRVEMYEVEGVIFLFIATSGATHARVGNDAAMTFYKWEGAHFDDFYSLNIPFITDICPFVIHGHFFVAVSVRDATNPYPDHSFVLRYNRHSDVFEIEQYFATFGAQDWEFFTISEGRDQEHFLLLASDLPDESGIVRSVIFKYIWHKFVVFQCIYVTGATQWHAIIEKDDILLVLSADTGISFYQYDGWRFCDLSVPIPDPVLESPLCSFSAEKLGNTTYLAVASASKSDQRSSFTVFSLVFNWTNPLGDYQATLDAQCESLRQKQVEAHQRIEEMSRQLMSIVYLNHNETQVITGNVTFNGFVFASNVSSENVYANERHIFNSSEHVQYDNLVDETNDQTEFITWLEDRMNKTMKVLGSQTVIESKSFASVVATTTLPSVALIVTSDLVNDHINLTDLDTNVLRKDRNQTLQVPITLNGDLILEDSLDVAGLVDNVNFSKVITLSGNHTVTEPIGFKSAVNLTGDVFVKGTTDGINISTGGVLLKTGHQMIEGVLVFEKGVYMNDDLSVDGLVNKWNLSDLQQYALYKDRNNIVTGFNRFVSSMQSLEGLSLDVGTTIDGVDLDLLKQTSFKVNQNQEITGFYEFTQDVYLMGEMNVSGSVNGLNLPEDVLLAQGYDEVTLSGPITFAKNLTVSNLTVGKEIDGVTVLGAGTLDLLLVNSEDEQVISGYLSFDDAIMWDDCVVDGLVNGIDLQFLASDALYKEGDFNITGMKEFDEPVIFEELIEILGLISGENLTNLDKQVLRLSDSDWTFSQELLFISDNVQFEASLDTLGNHLFQDVALQDLVTQGSTETIEGSKSFIGSMATEDHTNFTQLVNGVSLDEFCDRVIFLENDEVVFVSGDIQVTDDVKMTGNLSVTGTIDGILFWDVVTVIGDQEISAPKNFLGDVNSKMADVLGNIDLEGYVNEVNFTAVIWDTLYKFGPQHVSGTKVFADKLRLKDDLFVEGNISSLDFSSIMNDAVLLEGNFTVTGSKTFQAPVGLEDISIEGLVNNINFTEFVSDVWLQRQNQAIYGNITFMNKVTVGGNISMIGEVNGNDMQDLWQSVVMKTDDVFAGDLHFSNVFSNDSINVDAFIDGVNISGDVLLKDRENQVISGLKDFVQKVWIRDDLETNTINGISLSLLDQSVMKNSGDQNVSYQLIFWNGITILDNLTLGGLIDDVDIVELSLEAWRSTYANPESIILNITNNGTFYFLNTHDVLYYNKTLDGVDIRELNRTYVSLTKSQAIQSSKTFMHSINIPYETKARAPFIDLDGRIQNLSLVDLSERLFISGAGQTFTGILMFEKNVSFEGNIAVDGLVDGIDISGNLMMTNKINNVKAFKNFTGSPLTVEGSLFMKNRRTVNDVDISEWKANAADTIGNFIIGFDTNLSTVIFASDLWVDGLINGVNFSTSYLFTIPHDQRVTGDFTFLEDTNFFGDVTAVTINGLDMVDFATNTLFTTGDFIINGSKTLMSAASFTDITPKGLVGGIRVPRLYRRIYTYSDYDMFMDHLDEQCDIIDDIYNSQQNGAFILRGIEETLSVNLTGRAKWLPLTTGDSTVLALVSYPDTKFSSCGKLSLYSWDDYGGKYKFLTEEVTHDVADVELFNLDDLFGFAILENQIGKGCNNLTTGNGQFPNPTKLDTAFLHLDISSVDSVLHVTIHDSDNDMVYYQQIPGLGSADVDVFTIPELNQTCLFVVNERNATMEKTAVDSHLYCTEDLRLGFSFVQGIPTRGAKKATHFMQDEEVFIVIANRADSDLQSFTTSSEVWKYSADFMSFRNVSAAITSAVSDVAAFSINEEDFVAFSNEFDGSLGYENYQQTVDIYKFADNNLHLFQQIDSFGPQALSFTSMRSDYFLLVLDRAQYIRVYQYQGFLGFQPFQSVFVRGSYHVSALPHLFQTFVNVYDEEQLLFPSDEENPTMANHLIFDNIGTGMRTSAAGCSFTNDISSPSSNKTVLEVQQEAQKEIYESLLSALLPFDTMDI